LGLNRLSTHKKKDRQSVVNWGYIGPYVDTQIRKYDNWGYIGPVIRIDSKQSSINKGNIGQFGVK